MAACQEVQTEVNEKLRYALNCLDDLYLRHERVHLLFSGGKDSTLCLQHILERSYGSRTVLVVVDTGAMPISTMNWINSYSHTVAGVKVLRSSVRQWIRDHGFPVDIVNIDRTHEGRYLLKKKTGIKVCSRQACCEANLWIPLRQFIASGEATAVVMGEKNSDPRGAMPNEWIEGGVRVEVCRPLAFMTDDEVRDDLHWYLGSAYPKQFDASHSSIDCTCCTAYWDNYKERAPYLDDGAKKVVKAVLADVRKDLDRAINVIDSNFGAE